MDNINLRKISPSSTIWIPMMDIYYRSFEPRVIRCDVAELVDKKRMDAYCFELGTNKIILENSGIIVGTALVRSMSLDESRKFALLEYFAISSEHRNKGLGSKMISQLQSSLRESNHQFALAEIPLFGENTEKRKNFYSKSGWMSIDSMGPYKMPTVDDYTNKFSEKIFKDESIIILPIKDRDRDLIDRETMRNAVYMIYSQVYELRDHVCYNLSFQAIPESDQKLKLAPLISDSKLENISEYPTWYKMILP